jgi:hypothetical protein
MAKNNNKHVVKNGTNWQVKQSGLAVSVHSTQREAERDAIWRAKIDGSEVVVHGRDGKIRSKDSYGNDPITIKDREH